MCLSEQRFHSVIASEFRRLRAPVKNILGEDIPQEYEVKAATVRGAVKAARVSVGSNVSCIIPIMKERGKIGGSGMYGATGGAHGWNIKGKYQVKAKIVKGGRSILPGGIATMGGMPPFRNYSASKLRGMTFTRKGKARFPIAPVEGIAIPQMPLNRSKDAIEKDVKELLEKRMEHVLEQVLLGNIR